MFTNHKIKLWFTLIFLSTKFDILLPYRRGSWRPIGHMRPSSPLLDSVRDLFEGQEQLAKDFTRGFAHFDGKFPEEPKSKASSAMSKMGDKIRNSSFRSKKNTPNPSLQALQKFEVESFDSPCKKETSISNLTKKLEFGSYESLTMNLFDVTFLVGQGKTKTRLLGVRAILGVRSR